MIQVWDKKTQKKYLPKRVFVSVVFEENEMPYLAIDKTLEAVAENVYARHLVGVYKLKKYVRVRTKPQLVTVK